MNENEVIRNTLLWVLVELKHARGKKGFIAKVQAKLDSLKEQTDE